MTLYCFRCARGRGRRRVTHGQRGRTMIARLLHQRDAARDAGDRLARAVQAHLRGDPVDLAAALRAYGEEDGPEWACRPVERPAARPR